MTENKLSQLLEAKRSLLEAFDRDDLTTLAIGTPSHLHYLYTDTDIMGRIVLSVLDELNEELKRLGVNL